MLRASNTPKSHTIAKNVEGSIFSLMDTLELIIAAAKSFNIFLIF